MSIVEKDKLAGLVGTKVGTSEWFEIDQDRVNLFADVTEDHQFIHVNPEMAKQTPFGGPIAHGFLSLSLLSKLAESAVLTVKGTVMGINYGFDKVRFINPVRVGGEVRGAFTLKSATEKSPQQILLTYDVVVEIEGQEKPALIAEWLVMQVLGA